ncbi:hypothetical protein TPB0596_02110 [Tsukamurella pulmonis]|uniref:DUF4328 domain-containing protein n=1 Tax=Tsukamurella pulmonis TaxID=47312 RepID=A0A1H1HTD1_9ACTN|nr:DUF4328 domain-containing protein [Tsukamurella pulmonis]KXO94390.1 hypothetical protein AXK56_17165 [Tsukamurella pulmonis]BDD80448.1 hypothetical protein TPB0596_02110 [Tsukamurella pulmonis]SDR28674.1 protein of unknown function [Tsukamurella pulmonis]SUP13244.1 Uncharacterised protein [Tsukamurella pulmonis]
MHPNPSRTAQPRSRLRWLARRPPETLPVPRRAPSGPTPTPRYPAVPRWGLRQDFTPAAPAAPTAAESAAESTPFVLRLTTGIVFAAAAVEFLAYLLLVINRAGPVPGWLAVVATVAVFAIGWLAVLAVLALFVVLALWLQDSRARAYAQLGTREPRPRWQLWVYCLVPVVNLVAAPVLVLELADAQRRADGLATDRRAMFIRRWWVAWVALTMVTVGCVAYARAAGGLQHGADAMVYTTLTYLLSGLFLLGTARLVRMIDGGPGTAREREDGTRWLAA